MNATLICFPGAFLSLLVRIVNHISFLIIDDDIIPVAVYLHLIRIGKFPISIYRMTNEMKLSAWFRCYYSNMWKSMDPYHAVPNGNVDLRILIQLTEFFYSG